MFGLCPELLRAVSKLGWQAPTAIQREALPPALAGHDLIALAQTGTGKTAVYLLPVLARYTNLNCWGCFPGRSRNTAYCSRKR